MFLVASGLRIRGAVTLQTPRYFPSESISDWKIFFRNRGKAKGFGLFPPNILNTDITDYGNYVLTKAVAEGEGGHGFHLL